VIQHGLRARRDLLIMCEVSSGTRSHPQSRRDGYTQLTAIHRRTPSRGARR
jgi:hypothetical protein